MNKTLALVASVLLTAPLVSFAAPGDGPVKGDKSFTVSGSGTSDNDFDNTAYGVSGELGYFLTDKWQAGLRQSVNGVDQDQGGNSWAGSTRGFIMYNFLDGNYRPYLGANLGGIYGEIRFRHWRRRYRSRYEAVRTEEDLHQLRRRVLMAVRQHRFLRERVK